MKLKQYLWSLNSSIAMRVILALSTMECAYLFTIWSILPLLYPGSRDFVFYISGGILQLVLLPLILVGQNILNQKTEVRAEADHKAVMEILSDIQALVEQDRSLQQEENEEIIDLHEINDRLIRIEKLIKPPRRKPTSRRST